MGRSGYCCSLSDDDHKKCPDAIEDTGACDCPCHLDQEEDVEVSRIRTAQTSVGKINLASPSQDYEQAGATHPCLACGTDIHRVPGGAGPTWVHVATSLVFCTTNKEER